MKYKFIKIKDMYTLRIIENERENKKKAFDQTIDNFELGDAYSKVDRGTKEFDRIMKKMFPNEKKDNIKTIICADNGKVFFIFKNEENKIYSYFIISENGKTFEKL